MSQAQLFQENTSWNPNKKSYVFSK